MVSRIIILALAILAASAQAAEVYKTVDKDGNVVFTDEAPPGAQKVEIEEPMTFRSETYTNPYGNALNDPPEAEIQATDYKMSILTPGHEETIRDNTGELVVTWDIKPGVGSGDKGVLLMDGTPVADVMRSGGTTLANIDRGSHTLQLRITRAGAEPQVSEPVIVHLHRAFIRR